MPDAYFKPPEVQLDTVKEGVARIYFRWDFQTTTTKEGVPIFRYQEAWIDWSLTDVEYDGQAVTLETRADVEAYITANAAYIGGFARKSKLNL